MAWRVEYENSAARELRALDRQTIERILIFLRDRIVPADNPRILGEPLKGRFAGLWKYRVGDYRIVVRIEDAAGRIVVARIGNRREVYRR
jgi:mRNA interferase RelE/StbE